MRGANRLGRTTTESSSGSVCSSARGDRPAAYTPARKEILLRLWRHHFMVPPALFRGLSFLAIAAKALEHTPHRVIIEDARFAKRQNLIVLLSEHLDLRREL
jgi:hypothetical protein